MSARILTRSSCTEKTSSLTVRTRKADVPPSFENGSMTRIVEHKKVDKMRATARLDANGYIFRIFEGSILICEIIRCHTIDKTVVTAANKPITLAYILTLYRRTRPLSTEF